jgi:hypothetical protein
MKGALEPRICEGSSLHHSGARRENGCMRARALSLAFSLVAGPFALACGGDYWLGGARQSSHGDVTSTPADGGATASRDGGRVASPDAAPVVPSDGVSARVLTGDIVLRGGDSYDASAGDGGTCRLVGNGHSIRSDDTWVGRLTIRRCVVEGLGGGKTPAIDVDVSGTGDVTIEDSTFSRSGAIDVTNDGDSTTAFRGNVIQSDSTVPLDASVDASTPAFTARGASTQQKYFQGNRIYRSSIWFDSPNWLIGGNTDAESNILVGLRAGIVLNASGIVLRGNYVHVLHFDPAGDESALQALYGTTDTLAEHNVLRGWSWVLRGFGGELRYNQILDTDSVSWVYQPFENTKIHHNVFLMCRRPSIEVQAGIFLVNNRAKGIEVYNNTLDAGGKDMMLTGAAVAIDPGCFLDSLRSNVVVHFPFFRNDGGAAAVRPGITESVVPPPARLGYADYNLFFNPDFSNPDPGAPRNYAVSVAGLTVRRDTGFGAHDARAGGPVDEQVDPAPLGFSGDCFPWSDEDIEASRVTVSKILAATRTAYTPAPGSPMLAGGDPADGAANFVGAVGDGSSTTDRFGRFGR